MKSNIPTQWINLIRQKPNLFMPYQSGSQQLVYYQENGVDIGTIYQKYYRGIHQISLTMLLMTLFIISSNRS